jgi:DNA-binding protein HU-beta
MKQQTVTYTELVARVVTATGLTKVATKQTLDALQDEITYALARGEDVSLASLGKFEVTDKPAGEARNPRTGGIVKVPAKKVAKFKVSKTLKDHLK